MESMESFFQDWASRQQHLLTQLQSAPRDDPARLRGLLDRVLAHYREYFHEKSRLGAHNVLLLFSPSWLNPHERTFLWITGWRPSLAFPLLLRGVHEISIHQRQAVEGMRRETAAAERELSEEMARVQEEMATPQMLGLLRGVRNRNGEELRSTEAVVDSLRLLAASADALCVRTVNGLVEILSPSQAVDFFIEVVRFGLRIREWGERRRAERSSAV